MTVRKGGDKYFCTICSKDKSNKPGLLEANERYISPRINYVIKIAARESAPMLILSGKYGLISPDKKIPFYDLLLKKSRVEELVTKVIKQCRKLKIGELIFYAKSRRKQGWGPYYAVLEQASRRLKIDLKVIMLK